jgi:AbrB family looped-hinge helix DNA binding protein
MEETVQMVRAFESGKPDSLVIVIPKELRERLKIEKGTKFHVKLDEHNRIIYEPINRE